MRGRPERRPAVNEGLLHLIISQQHEIYVSIWISNWLALFGRAMDLGMLWLLHRCWVLLRAK